MASTDNKAAPKPEAPAADQKPAEQKNPAALGEDDEFEDFPSDGTFRLPALSLNVPLLLFFLC